MKLNKINMGRFAEPVYKFPSIDLLDFNKIQIYPKYRTQRYRINESALQMLLLQYD